MAKVFEKLLELPAGDDKSDRQFVTALARGLEILRTFQPGDGPLGNQEIAERTGLPKPTVSRITHTLTKLGYLEYVPRLAKYWPGVGVLSLGHVYLGALGIRGVARPHMQELAEYAEASVALGARDRLSMTYLDVARGSRTVAFSLDAGSRVPLWRSAMGMAYLSALPDKERDFLLDAVKRQQGKDWPEARGRIEQAFRDLDEHGFCIAIGHYERAMNGAGAPFVSRDGREVYGFSCSAPSFQFTEERIREDIGPRLVSLVQAVASDLDRRPFADR